MAGLWNRRCWRRALFNGLVQMGGKFQIDQGPGFGIQAARRHPDAKFVLVVGDGINQLDASGEEVIHHLVDRLKGAGITLVFSGLKKQVLDVMRATGLFDAISQDNIFPTEEHAITAIYEQLGTEAADDLFCAESPAR